MTRATIRAIIPDTQMVNVDYFIDEIKSMMRNKSVPAVTDDFKRGVRTWANKPDFKSIIVSSRTKIQADIFPSGSNKQQYLWVHNGVPGRLITPRANNRSGVLTFRGGYVSATRPGFITSRRGFRTGGFYSHKAVNWPGIEARNFSRTIAALHKTRFIKDVNDVLRRSVHRL